MFFYLEDMFKYGHHVHIETENTSFIKMWRLLERMGVRNNKFMLYLHDKNLAHVKPHEIANPTPELAVRIVTECAINPWYFMREIVRVPAQGGDPKPYILHRGNMALIWNFFQSIHTYLRLPRQHYKTVSAMANVAQLLYFGSKNFPMSLFTKDNGAVIDNVERLKEIRDGMPQWLLHRTPQDKDNEKGVTYDYLNNRYKTVCASKEKLGADKKAKGGSMAVQHWDEYEMIPNLRIMYPAALAATNEAIENAKANGVVHANMITTTCGFADTDHCQFAQEVLGSCMPFNEYLYDCRNRDELVAKLKQHSSNEMFSITYSYLQLGKTDEWMERIIASEKSDRAKILRDYYLIPASGTEEEGLPTKHLTTMRKNQRTPTHTTFSPEGYDTNWYITKDYRESHTFRTKKYLLTMDSSEAVGRDFISLTLLDPYDLSLAATIRTNETNILKMGYYIAKLLIDNSNYIFIPEAKSSGRQIIDTVLTELVAANVNPFKRIYNDVFQEPNDPKYAHIDINFYAGIVDSKDRKVFGFKTAGSGEHSRSILYGRNVMWRAVKMNAARMYDVTLIDEFCSLVIKNGKIDHQAGGHDDLVISYLLGCWFVYLGKNLHKYGIDTSKLLEGLDEEGNTVDVAAVNERQAILKHIEQLEKTMQELNSSILVESCKRQLKIAEAQLEALGEDKEVVLAASSPMTASAVMEDKKQELDMSHLQHLNTVQNLMTSSSPRFRFF